MSCPRSRKSPAGFTLIELLVVIAIIGLLIGILLPALGAARNSGRRVACLSNQRQLAIAVFAYADDFDGQMPLGHSLGPGAGWRQYNYLLRSVGGDGSWAMRWMGLLYNHGAFESPEAFYSPAEKDELVQLDTEINPWPVRGAEAETVVAGRSTRIGYGVRPLVAWPFPRDLEQPGGLPRLFNQLGTRALLADLIHKPERLELRHGSGVNAVFMDGSGRWQDRGVLDALEIDGVTWEETDNTGFSPMFNDLFLSEDPETGLDRGLWAELDR